MNKATSVLPIVINPVKCRHCDNRVWPTIKTIHLADPYPKSMEEVGKVIPEGTIPLVAYWNRKSILDRHGNVIDYDSEVRVFSTIIWDQKSFGHDGLCGPCHVVAVGEPKTGAEVAPEPARELHPLLRAALQ